MRLALLALVLLTTAAEGQSRSPGSDRNARVQTIEFSSGGGLYRVPTASGAVQTISFANGERIRSLVLSAPDSYAIDLTKAGDGFTLKPRGAATLTLLSVRTDSRSYELELVPGPAREAAPVVRFSYGGPRMPVGPRPGPLPANEDSNWRLSGDKTLRPASLHDDGRKTYLTWPAEQGMPAVFAVGPSGKEEMVEGYMRAGVFTIDRVYSRLTFRIDKRSAKARRVGEQADND